MSPVLALQRINIACSMWNDWASDHTMKLHLWTLVLCHSCYDGLVISKLIVNPFFKTSWLYLYFVFYYSWSSLYFFLSALYFFLSALSSPGLVWVQSRYHDRKFRAINYLVIMENQQTPDVWLTVTSCSCYHKLSTSSVTFGQVLHV